MLIFLVTFEQESLYFRLVLGPTNYAAGPGQQCDVEKPCSCSKDGCPNEDVIPALKEPLSSDREGNVCLVFPCSVCWDREAWRRECLTQLGTNS